MDDETEQQHFQRVLKSFRAYERYSLVLLQQKKKYLREVPKEDQELVKKLAARLNRSEEAVKTNAQFIGKVLSPKSLFSNAGEIEPNSNGPEAGGSNGLTLSDVDRVRTVLKQIAREWSDAGKVERNQSFQPLIDVVEEHFGKTPVSDRKSIRILVPGAGLARLPWELARLGYTVQGNDFSYYHLLIANYILNFAHGDVSEDPNAGNGSSPKSIVYPYIHQTNNVVREENQFLAVGVPDVNPRQLPTTGAEFSMIGGEFVDVYAGQHESWDCICTCFFIDTARNVVQYIRTIKNLLRPGGIWANLGPLLYHYADMFNENSIELTLEEVLQVTTDLGLEIVQNDYRRCAYSSDQKSMFKVEYDCLFFLARKPVQ